MSSHHKSPPNAPVRGRSRGAPRNIANAVVIKNNDVFFLAEHGRSVPAGNQDGFGLYYHDCRYLNGYEVQIAGTRPNPLVSTCEQGQFHKLSPRQSVPELRASTGPVR